MKKEIKDILTADLKQSILIGIGIALFYFFSYYPVSGFSFRILVINIIFGSVVGYTIFVGESLSDWILKEKFPPYEQYLILPIINSFLVSVVIFNLVAKLFNLLITGFMDYPYIFYISIAVGFISAIISMFYYAIEKQKEAVRLEKKTKKLAVLEERNRIARELHDSVSQNLFGVNLQLNTLENLLKGDIKRAKAKEMVELSKEMVQEVQTEMRLMIYELRPTQLTEKNFFVALEDLVNLYRNRYQLEIRSDFKGDEDLVSEQIQLVVYRVLQESLNNVVKHAQASQVEVSLNINRPESLKLMVRDDGIGFNPKLITKSEGAVGLTSMQERVGEVLGELKIESEIGQGTTIKVII